MHRNYKIYFLILFVFAVAFSEYNFTSDNFLLYIINPVQSNFTLSDSLDLISNYSYVLYVISPVYENFTLPNTLNLNITNSSLIIITPVQNNFTLPSTLNLSSNVSTGSSNELYIYDQSYVPIVYNDNYLNYAENLSNYLLSQNYSVILIPEETYFTEGYYQYYDNIFYIGPINTNFLSFYLQNATIITLPNFLGTTTSLTNPSILNYDPIILNGFEDASYVGGSFQSLSTYDYCYVGNTDYCALGYDNISNNNTIVFFDFNDYTNENKTTILLNLVNFLLGSTNFITTTFTYDNTTNNLTLFVNVSSDNVSYTTVSLYYENGSLIEEYNTTNSSFTYSLSFPVSGEYNLIISSYDENGTLLSQITKTFNVIIYNLYINNVTYNESENYFNVSVCSAISNVSSNVSLFIDGELLEKKPVYFENIGCENVLFYLNDTSLCGEGINITAYVDPIASESLTKDNVKTIIKNFQCSQVNFISGMSSYNAPEDPLYILVVFIIMVIYLETREMIKEKLKI